MTPAPARRRPPPRSRRAGTVHAELLVVRRLDHGDVERLVAVARRDQSGARFRGRDRGRRRQPRARRLREQRRQRWRRRSDRGPCRGRAARGARRLRIRRPHAGSGNGRSSTSAGVVATAARCTDRAPARRSAASAERSVEPVVTTSSTTSTRRPAAPGAALNTGPCSRWTRSRPVCGAPRSSRSSRRRHGSPSWAATRRATTSAWSNPRRYRRRVDVGAHVTTSRSAGRTPAAIRRLTSSPAR